MANPIQLHKINGNYNNQWNKRIFLNLIISSSPTSIPSISKKSLFPCSNLFLFVFDFSSNIFPKNISQCNFKNFFFKLKIQKSLKPVFNFGPNKSTNTLASVPANFISDVVTNTL